MSPPNLSFSIIMMVARNKTRKHTCNSAPTTIYCAVGEKSKFKMPNSNNSWHGKFLKLSGLKCKLKIGH